MENKKGSFIKGLLSGVIVTAMVLTIVYCILINVQADRILQLASANDDSAAISSEGLVDKEVTDKIDAITEAINRNFYFMENVDQEEMKEKIYAGILDSLDDPYSVYYTPEEFNDLMDSSEGIYYGIGSYVTMDEVSGLAMLSGVFDDSPAKEAGLRDGDLIYLVDGKETTGMTLTEIVALIRGEENTQVVLTIVRSGASDYIEATVTRRRVISPTVKYEMKENSIGYIQIEEFDEVTIDQFKEAYTDLNQQNMKALILDLRSNTGGNLDSVLAICRNFLPQGIITYTEDKYGNKETYSCDGKNEIEIPMVVLTNGYTASASEILAGAVRDYELGTLIGTTTFGKGIVQKIYQLTDGSGIKLTISKYFTPSGENIHKTGIAPDIELEFDSELYYGEQKIDNQLDYALLYLQKELGLISGDITANDISANE